MAIIDKSQNKWYVNDRDENVSIGLKLKLCATDSNSFIISF